MNHSFSLRRALCFAAMFLFTFGCGGDGGGDGGGQETDSAANGSPVSDVDSGEVLPDCAEELGGTCLIDCAGAGFVVTESAFGGCAAEEQCCVKPTCEDIGGVCVTDCTAGGYSDLENGQCDTGVCCMPPDCQGSYGGTCSPDMCPVDTAGQTSSEEVAFPYSGCGSGEVCCAEYLDLSCNLQLNGTCYGATGLYPITERIVFDDCEGDKVCHTAPLQLCERDLGGVCTPQNEWCFGETSSTRLVTIDCTEGTKCCYPPACIGDGGWNNSISKATPLGLLPASGCGMAPQGDPSDYWSFSVPAGTDVIVYINETGGNIYAPAVLTLYKPDDLFNPIASNDGFNSLPGVFTFIEAPDLDGDYLLEFRQPFGSSYGRYKIHVTEPDCSEPGERACDGHILKTCSSIKVWGEISCAEDCVENIGGTEEVACVDSAVLPFESQKSTYFQTMLDQTVPYYYAIDITEDVTELSIELSGEAIDVGPLNVEATREWSLVHVEGGVFVEEITPTMDRGAVVALSTGTYWLKVLPTLSPGLYKAVLAETNCAAHGDRECSGNVLKVCSPYETWEEFSCLDTCGDRGDGVQECNGSSNNCWSAVDLDDQTLPYHHTYTENNISAGTGDYICGAGDNIPWWSVDYWFSFTAPAADVTFSITDYVYADPWFAVMEGTCGDLSDPSPTLSEVYCGNASSNGRTVFGLVPGNIYYLVVIDNSADKLPGTTITIDIE